MTAARLAEMVHAWATIVRRHDQNSLPGKRQESKENRAPKRMGALFHLFIVYAWLGICIQTPF